MNTTEGFCPSCETAGAVGTPCPEKACSLREYHRIPREWFDRLLAVSPADRDPLIGRMIGDYLVVSGIGSGGFGRVYLVLQQPIQMKAALKIMHRDNLQATAIGSLRNKFLMEAQALASLSHPNIVRLLKYGHQGELPYLVMEYVPGKSLKAIINDLILIGEEIGDDVVFHILEQLLNALEAAHSIGLVHRDIKPENLMVQQIPGDPWHVKVLDFGLAKFLEGSRDTTMMIGTPQYMAPEQIARKNIGPWTDLYAVGVLAFELITGRRPFAGRTTQEVLGKKLDPSYDVNSRLSDLDVPPFLQHFFHMAMARNVEDRISSVPQFRKALTQVFEKLRDAHLQSRGSVDLSSLLDSSDLARLQEEKRRLEEERIRLEQDRARIEEEKRQLEARRLQEAALPARRFEEVAATIAETLPASPGPLANGKTAVPAPVDKEPTGRTGRPEESQTDLGQESRRRGSRASLLGKGVAFLAGILLVGAGIAWWQQGQRSPPGGLAITDIPAGTGQPDPLPDAVVQRDLTPEEPPLPAEAPAESQGDIPAAREPAPDVQSVERTAPDPGPAQVAPPPPAPKPSPGTVPAARPALKAPERGKSVPRRIIPIPF
ncbi:MAG TPA: protein kinase [Myxococcota bacterium]|nr:protein kinase [Myxococcota bacterium]HQK52331.1 protein kinase [Myxococcota bacterium]